MPHGVTYIRKIQLKETFSDGFRGVAKQEGVSVGKSSRTLPGPVSKDLTDRTLRKQELDVIGMISGCTSTSLSWASVGSRDWPSSEEGKKYVPEINTVLPIMANADSFYVLRVGGSAEANDLLMVKFCFLRIGQHRSG